MAKPSPKRVLKGKAKAPSSFGVKEVERKFWVGFAVALLVVVVGVLAIMVAPSGDPRVIAIGLLVAMCGALTWAVLKIIGYFKVVVAFMLRESEKAAKADDSDMPRESGKPGKADDSDTWFP